MNPIWIKQINARGVGYDFNQLMERFVQICNEHKETGRAKAFAVILYAVESEELAQLLDDRDAFTRLDRLSGKDLTVFYLDCQSRSILDQFNDTFARLFDVPHDTRLPYVVFFSLENDDAVAISIRELTDLKPEFVYHELYSVIASYISSSTDFKQGSVEKKEPQTNNLFSTIKKVGLEKFIEFLIAEAMNALSKHL
jgi:hypothetical protein